MENIVFDIGDYSYKVIRDSEVSVRVIDGSKEKYAPVPCTVEHEGVVYTVTEMGFCFSYCGSLVVAPIIPDSVTNMRCCFAGCSSLVKAPAIPKGVTNMESCFDGCSSLVEAPTIPKGVTNMESCFDGCRSLVKAPAISCGVKNMYACFAGCSALVEAPIIPNGVTDMGWCFSNCISLIKAPVIPNGVTNMAGCFYNCSSLMKAPVIPDSVANMYECFENCTSLVEAPAIPNSGTDMLYCFSGCSFEGAFAASANASLDLFAWNSKQQTYLEKRTYSYRDYKNRICHDDYICYCVMPNGYRIGRTQHKHIAFGMIYELIMVNEKEERMCSCEWYYEKGWVLGPVPTPDGGVVVWLCNGIAYEWRIKDGEIEPRNLTNGLNGLRVTDARMQNDGILELLCENGSIIRYWCDEGLFFLPEENAWTQGKKKPYDKYLENPPDWFVLMICNEDYGREYRDTYTHRVCFEPGLETIEPMELAGTSLKKVVIPAHVQRVKSLAFWNCDELEELVIEGDLSRVANWAEDAFEDCPCEEYYLKLRNSV